jgi:hypothetical protein
LDGEGDKGFKGSGIQGVKACGELSRVVKGVEVKNHLNPRTLDSLTPVFDMIDVQNQKDDRQIPIDKVGVKNIRYPITVRDKENGFQQTVASINMYVDLPHDHKGTHMSRFIEVLSE